MNGGNLPTKKEADGEDEKKDGAKGKEKSKEKKKTDGVIYNIPGKAQVTVFTPNKRYFDGELPVTQFGTTECLVDNLFNKKVNTRVIFNPNTGGIVKIDKD